MKRKYNKKSDQQLRIAKQRIKELFHEASGIFATSQTLSDRYVEIARKIAMKYKVKIPTVLKKQFCKHCYKFVVPGSNVRIRLNKGKLVYYCLSCKKFSRLPYRAIKKKAEKSKKIEPSKKQIITKK